MNTPITSNLRGILNMLIAVAAFSAMDVALKVLTPHYDARQVAAMRGLSSLPLVLVWVALSGGFATLRSRRWFLHLVRGVLSVLMLSLFAFALRELPLAEAYTLYFIAPLLVTAMAVPLLGERVGWQRWVAILVGLAGVVIVLRPDGSRMFTTGGLAVLIAASCYSLSAITVRVLGRTDSTQCMVFWTMSILSVIASCLAWPHWLPLRDEHWIVLFGLAISGAIGQYAVTEAFRNTAASVVVPFEYTALAWGLGFDWLLWDTLPDRTMLTGAGVIILSGLYLIRRERADRLPRPLDQADSKV